MALPSPALAWRAVDGDGLGLWYSWAIDDCSIGYTPINLSGYDVYRKSPDTTGFVKINIVNLRDTLFTDTNLMPGLYKYYIVALLGECTQGTPSDTIFADVITGLRQDPAGGIRIYPNPAKESVKIVSYRPCESAAIFDRLGILVKNYEKRELLTGTLSLQGLSAGLYYLKTSLGNEFKTFLLIKME